MDAVVGQTLWMRDVKVGDTLLVLQLSRLWPHEMWTSSSDDRTIVAVTPMLQSGDACAVLDTLVRGDTGEVCAALVVCSDGFGCVMLDASHFDLV